MSAMESIHKRWYISGSGFKALFYPLTGLFMDVDGKGMIRVDRRSQSLNAAFADPVFKSQLDLLSPDDFEKDALRAYCTRLCNELPSCSGGQSGFLGHFRFPSTDGDSESSSILSMFGQFLFYHPNSQSASNFDPGFSWARFDEDHAASSKVAMMAREKGVRGLENVHFLTTADKKSSVCKCAVHNVHMELEVIMTGNVGEFPNALETLSVKAIAHLHRQLVCYRSDIPSHLVTAPAVLAPDVNMCAYCADEGFTRMYCGKCQVFWYCSQKCQIKHWKMQGRFCHRRECKLMADPSVTKPAIPVGRLVMIHGLKSAAGQRLNGKDAIVVTPPTDQRRLGVVLVDDVSKDQQERLKRGDVGWVPTKLQKAIKFVNLELVWTASKI